MYGDWCYDDSLSRALVAHAGSNRWTTLALVEWMERACYQPDGEMWDLIIENGDRFLRAHPQGAEADEVRLHVGEAHETAWALAKGGVRTWSPEKLAAEAAGHRVRAIQRYEEYLRARPRGDESDAVRERLKKIRADVGTGYYRYWCPNTC